MNNNTTTTNNKNTNNNNSNSSGSRLLERECDYLAHHVLPVRKIYNYNLSTAAAAASSRSSRSSERFNHKYIVVTPLVSGACDLLEFLKASCSPPKRSVVVSIALQILKGLQRLHCLGVPHGNLKPSTVLCRSKNGQDMTGGGIDR